jgi:hypothetical protein
MDIKVYKNIKFDNSVYLKLSTDISRILKLQVLNDYCILEIVEKYRQKLMEKGYYTLNIC